MLRRRGGSTVKNTCSRLLLAESGHWWNESPIPQPQAQLHRTLTLRPQPPEQRLTRMRRPRLLPRNAHQFVIQPCPSHRTLHLDQRSSRQQVRARIVRKHRSAALNCKGLCSPYIVGDEPSVSFQPSFEADGTPQRVHSRGLLAMLTDSHKENTSMPHPANRTRRKIALSAFLLSPPPTGRGALHPADQDEGHHHCPRVELKRDGLAKWREQKRTCQ